MAHPTPKKKKGENPYSKKLRERKEEDNIKKQAIIDETIEEHKRREAEMKIRDFIAKSEKELKRLKRKEAILSITASVLKFWVALLVFQYIVHVIGNEFIRVMGN